MNSPHAASVAAPKPPPQEYGKRYVIPIRNSPRACIYCRCGLRISRHDRAWETGSQTGGTVCDGTSTGVEGSDGDCSTFVLGFGKSIVPEFEVQTCES